MRLVLILCISVALAAVGCNTNKVNSSSADVAQMGNGEFENKTDTISYALGQNLGQDLSTNEIEVNPDAFLAGMQVAFGDNPELAKLSEEEVRALIVAMQQEVQMRRMKEMQQNRNPQPQSSAVSIGQEAPEIALPSPKGETVRLTDLRGKYVLVDFWASWCRPCRAENPNVVRVYNQYKDKGFEILGVSLDRSKEAWVGAIEKDGLTWKHASDLKFWGSAAAQTYGVSAIPYTVLLDKEGKVIAQNLRGASLEAKLAELLGS